MAWYFYLAYFFAGFSIVNSIPHYVRGVTGHRFPTPFASPPGRGESPPIVNVVWGLFNFCLGVFFLTLGEFSFGYNLWTLTFVGAVVIASLQLSYFFSLV